MTSIVLTTKLARFSSLIVYTHLRVGPQIDKRVTHNSTAFEVFICYSAVILFQFRCVKMCFPDMNTGQTSVVVINSINNFGIELDTLAQGLASDCQRVKLSNFVHEAVNKIPL